MFAARRVLATYGATILTLVLLVAFTSVRRDAVPVGVLTAVATAVAVQLLVGRYYLRRAPRPPYSAVITGLLIGVVLPPSVSPWVVVGAAGLAMGSRYLVRIGDSPVFNPAAVGLLLPFAVLGVSATSWAGGATIPLGLAFAAPLALVVWTTRRLAVAVTFAAAYAIPALALSGRVPDFSDPWMMTLLASGLFAVAFVMVTDPKTSPFAGPGQAAFGAGVGLAMFSLSALGVADPFVYALLLGNLAYAVARHRPRLSEAWARARSLPPWPDPYAVLDGGSADRSVTDARAGTPSAGADGGDGADARGRDATAGGAAW